MILLGLTGDIACGKSTVAQMLQKRGAHVIDADLLVRELYSDVQFATRVAALFQHRVLNNPLLSADGTINRAALGALVFNDPAALKQLEALVHPAVAQRRAQKIAQLNAPDAPDAPNKSNAPQVIVLEAVKLVESGQASDCDLVWWVRCERAVQLRRLTQNRGLTEAAALLRIRQQPSPEKKREMLGRMPLVVIANNGTTHELETIVIREWEKLNSENGMRSAFVSTQ